MNTISILLLLSTVMTVFADEAKLSDFDALCSMRKNGVYCDNDGYWHLVWCRDKKAARKYTCSHGCETGSIPGEPAYCMTGTVEVFAQRYVDKDSDSDESKWYWELANDGKSDDGKCDGEAIATSRSMTVDKHSHSLQVWNFAGLDESVFDDFAVIYGAEVRVTSKTVEHYEEGESGKMECKMDEIEIRQGPLTSGDRHQQRGPIGAAWEEQVYGGRRDVWDRFSDAHYFHQGTLFWVELQYDVEGEPSDEHSKVRCAVDCVSMRVFYDETPKGTKTMLVKKGGDGARWDYWWSMTAPPDDWSSEEFDAEAHKWPSGYGIFAYNDEPQGGSIDDVVADTALAALDITKDGMPVKPLAAYFRHRFEASAEPECYRHLKLTTRFDDGAVLYLNDEILWYYQMPAPYPDRPNNETRAYLTKDSQYYHYNMLPENALLRKGWNTLAIEVHDWSSKSGDMLFDVQLEAYDECENDKLPVIDTSKPVRCTVATKSCACRNDGTCDADLVCTEDNVCIPSTSVGDAEPRTDIFLWLFIATLLLGASFFAIGWYRRRKRVRAFARVDGGAPMESGTATVRLEEDEEW